MNVCEALKGGPSVRNVIVTFEQKPVLRLAQVIDQMGRINGDFAKGEADGSRDALQLITIAADRLRPRLLS